MVKETQWIQVSELVEKVPDTRLSVSALLAAHSGETASLLSSEKWEASAVHLMLVTVIMLISRPRQATQLTGEHTDTRNTPWVFIVVHPEAVWTAEPVEKDLKACSDQAATAAFVYNTGGSKTFSSLEISRKLDNSAHVKTVYSEWLNTWCVYAHVMIRSLYFASM